MYMLLFFLSYSNNQFDYSFDSDYSPEFFLYFHGIGSGNSPMLHHNMTQFPFFSKNPNKTRKLDAIKDVFLPIENTKLDTRIIFNRNQTGKILLNLKNDTSTYNIINNAIRNNFYIQLSFQDIPFWIRIGTYDNNGNIYLYLNHKFLMESNKKSILTITDLPTNQTIYQQNEFQIRYETQWKNNPSISPIRRYNIFWRKSFFSSRHKFGILILVYSTVIAFLLYLIFLLHKNHCIQSAPFSIEPFTNALSSLSGVGSSYSIQSFIYPILVMILGSYFNFKRLIYVYSYSMAIMMFISGYIGTTLGFNLKKTFWVKICLFNVIGSLYLIFLVPLSHFFFILILSAILSFSGGKLAIEEPLIEVWEDNIIMMIEKAKPKPITILDIAYYFIISIPLGIVFFITIYYITYFLLIYNFVFSILTMLFGLIIMHLYIANISIRIAINKQNAGDSSWQWSTFLAPLPSSIYFLLSLIYWFNYFIRDMNSGAMQDSIFFSFLLSTLFGLSLGSTSLISSSLFMYIHTRE